MPYIFIKLSQSLQDKAIAACSRAVHKARGSLQSKLKQGGEAKEGSRLKEARVHLIQACN